mmetsp:Transcript_6797/g.16601  ORF Transcript_6797/g.16601 Transcript_6797/m.16601 type:complete len:146 (-) Transcript_6797:251-688(-)
MATAKRFRKRARRTTIALALLALLGVAAGGVEAARLTEASEFMMSDGFEGRPDVAGLAFRGIVLNQHPRRQLSDLAAPVAGEGFPATSSPCPEAAAATPCSLMAKQGGLLSVAATGRRSLSGTRGTLPPKLIQAGQLSSVLSSQG